MRLLLSIASFILAAKFSCAAPVTTLIFSPDGKSLISNAHGKIELRSVENGAAQAGIPCEIKRITSLAFAPSGKYLAVAGGEPGHSGELAIFAWPARGMIFHATNAADINTSVAFTKDGSLLASASADHKAVIYKMAKDGKASEPIILSAHTAPILALAFDPLNSNLVTAGADRSIKVWSSKGQLLRTMSYHLDPVNALAFRPSREGSKSEFASASDDGTVRIWQPEIGRMVRIVRSHKGPILALSYHPDGTSFFTAGKEGIVRQFETDSDETLGSLPTKQDWIYSIAVHPECATLATADWKGQVRIWKLQKRKGRAGWFLP